MTKRYPFKFLDAYTQDDSDIFFGREEEVDTLYEMVFQTDLLLVYGASGTGKTSLIQCGLASRFQSHDWLALNIRRGSDLNASFDKILLDAAGHQHAGTDTPKGDLQGYLDWLDEDLTAETQIAASAKSLSPLARRLKAIYLRHFKPIYLIFDQFEELYILGNKAEQDAFIDTVQEILRVEQPVKIILSIREEYLGHLYEFERKVPQLLRKKLRVEPMHLEKVISVVTQTGRLPEGNVRLQAGEEAAIATAIFDRIKGKEKTLAIELPYLQVFLDKLYLQCSGDDTRQADALFSLAALEKMEAFDDVLRNFLDEQVLHTARTLDQKPETIWGILSPFVTLEGTKEPLSETELCLRLKDADPALVSKALEAFSKGRILRFTEQEQRYEIKHDSLAKQVHAKRSDEEIAILEVQRLVKSQVALKPEARQYFSENQLSSIIQPYRAKCTLTMEEEEWIERSREFVEAEKKAVALRQTEELEKAKTQAEQERRLRTTAEQARKNARRYTVVAVVVAILALIAFVIAVQQSREAEKHAKEAKYNAKVAEYNAKVAEEAKIKADTMAERAKKSEKEAIKQKNNAEKKTEETRSALDKFEKEQAAKERLQFKTKVVIVDNFIRAKECDLAKLALADLIKIVEKHPSDKEMKEAKERLNNAVNQCKK